MTGAELSYYRGAQFVAMPEPAGSQDTVFVYFQMRAPFEARFEKSNLRETEAVSIPSQRNDGTTHSYETSVSFFYMHFGQDVISKGIVSHLPLKTIAQNIVCCWGRGAGPVANDTPPIW